MAKLLNRPGLARNVDISTVDNRIELNINRNLSAKQVAAGILAKVQLRHPAFSCNLTIWRGTTGPWVAQVQQQGRKESWYPVVSLKEEVKAYIIDRYLHDTEDTSAWYLEMVNKEITIKPTDTESNEGLGIESIIIDDRLTANQITKDVICKVNINTTIGTLHGYTIWKSKFGTSLYGTAPIEGKLAEGEDAERGLAGYRLTREATAQVLSFLHKQVDFDAMPEIPEGVMPAVTAAEQDSAMAQAVASGFVPIEGVGDAMFTVK
jgi:hypothetical protein